MLVDAKNGEEDGRRRRPMKVYLRSSSYTFLLISSSRWIRPGAAEGVLDSSSFKSF